MLTPWRRVSSGQRRTIERLFDGWVLGYHGEYANLGLRKGDLLRLRPVSHVDAMSAKGILYRKDDTFYLTPEAIEEYADCVVGTNILGENAKQEDETTLLDRAT